MIQLSPVGPSVGVAPGTTTISIPRSQLGCGACVRPPVAGLGVCPPGFYDEAPRPTAAITPQAASAPGFYDPYGTDSKLRGLRGASGLRWDLLALTAGLGFAAVIGLALLRRK